MIATTSNASSRKKPALQPVGPLSLGETAAISASPVAAYPPDVPTLAMHSSASPMSGSPLMM
jgi:hypothetical protein